MYREMKVKGCGENETRKIKTKTQEKKNSNLFTKNIYITRIYNFRGNKTLGLKKKGERSGLGEKTKLKK